MLNEWKRSPSFGKQRILVTFWYTRKSMSLSKFSRAATLTDFPR